MVVPFADASKGVNFRAIFEGDVWHFAAGQGF